MDMDSKVWCILRPNLVSNVIHDLGIMGTGFFISEDKFVTSYHVINKDSFEPNDKYNSEQVILLNPLGEMITVTPNNDISYEEEKDITVIRFRDEHDFIELENEVQEGQPIFNLGYPSDRVTELLKLKEGKLWLKNPIKQEGDILKLQDNFSSNSSDVNIRNRSVIIANYSSEKGFSGGPLLNSDGRAIGILSMVIPNNYGDFSGKAIAIRITEL